MTDTALVGALRDAGLQPRTDVPLATRTWWRVGGPADVSVDTGSLCALQAAVRVCHDHAAPVFVLGNASNLLISDHGIRGVVLRLVGELAAASRDPDGTLRLGAGLKLVPFLRRSAREGFTGLEMLAGVPGTVGGAVVMNAGTALGEVSDALIDATVVCADGTAETLPAAALQLAYRTSVLPPGAVVAACTFRPSGLTPEQSARRIEEHLAYRARTQPVDVPTCGSTFRNPPGDHAGRLIDATGLKGATEGAAQVSTKHANFIVNTGGATATDIRRLIERVQAEVLAAHGVQLQREVHYAGDWPA